MPQEFEGGEIEIDNGIEFYFDEEIPKKFTGRIGNCMSPEISKIQLLDKTISYCLNCLKLIENIVKTTDEDEYSLKIKENTYSFYLIISLVMMNSLDLFLSKDLEISKRELNKNVIESLHSSLERRGRFDKLNKLVNSLIGDMK
jgi:hypothetical protein